MLWILFTVFVILGSCGAGVIPGILPVCALALGAAAAAGLAALRPRQRLLFWLMFAWFLALAATLLPLPSFLVGSRRNASFEQVERFQAEWEKAIAPTTGGSDSARKTETASRRLPRRLSLNVPGTGRFLFLFFAALSTFWAVASSSLRRRLWLAKALVILGVAVAAAAVIGRYVIPQNDWLLWWYPVAETDASKTMGPFINRNHFGTFLAMLAPLAFCFSLPASRNRERHFEAHRWDAAKFGWLAVLLALAAAVFLSLSRGGIFALLAGVGATAMYWLRADRRIATAAAGVGIALLVAVALWPDQALQERFQTLREKDSPDTARLEVWRQSLRLWCRYPIWGCGSNAYHAVSHPDSRLAPGKTATHSESDYLQLLAEEGLVGVSFALAVLALGGTTIYRATRRQREPMPREETAPSPAAGAGPWRKNHLRSRRRRPRPEKSGTGLPANLVSGVFGGLTALALHALVDVPLRVPLDACLAATLAGLVMPLKLSRTRFPTPLREALPERLALAAGILAGALVLWGRPGWEALYRDTIQADSADPPAASIARLQLAPDYWYLWALTERRLQSYARRKIDAPRRAAVIERLSLMALTRAAALNPTQPELLVELATRNWLAGRFDDARRAYQRLFALQPNDIGAQVDWMYIEWYSGNRTAARDIVERAVARDLPAKRKASLWQTLADLEKIRGSIQGRLEALRQAAALLPDNAKLLWEIAVCERDLGYRDEEFRTVKRITEIAPADWRAWWRLAEFYAGQKRGGLLNRALRNAVGHNPALRRKAAELWKKMTQTPKR